MAAVTSINGAVTTGCLGTTMWTLVEIRCPPNWNWFVGIDIGRSRSISARVP